MCILYKSANFLLLQFFFLSDCVGVDFQSDTFFDLFSHVKICTDNIKPTVDDYMYTVYIC